MTLICVLSPAGSPPLHCSRGVGVIYKFTKRFAVPQVESIVDLRANIFGASNKEDALQNNRLKTIARSEFHLRPHILSSSAASVKIEFSWPNQMVRHKVGWEFFSFPIALTTYHPHQLLHSDMCQDFGSPNTDRRQRVSCWRLWGKLPRGCSRLLGGRWQSRQHSYMVEGRPGLPGSLLGRVWRRWLVQGNHNYAVLL